MNIEHIKSLLCMRDNLYFAEQPKDGFTMEDLNIMLEYFCVINNFFFFFHNFFFFVNNFFKTRFFFFLQMYLEYKK